MGNVYELVDSSLDILGSNGRERMARYGESPYLLTKLAYDQSAHVRLAVAGNRFTPVDVLVNMVEWDNNNDRVFWKTLANNPSLPDHLRRKLMVSLLSEHYPGLENTPYEWVKDLYTHYINIGVVENE